MSNKSIFKDNTRPVLEKECLLVPEGMAFGGQVNPKLKPKEWFYLFYSAIQKGQTITNEELENFIKDRMESLGSRTTLWRIRKSLVKKGYL